MVMKVNNFSEREHMIVTDEIKNVQMITFDENEKIVRIWFYDENKRGIGYVKYKIANVLGIVND